MSLVKVKTGILTFLTFSGDVSLSQELGLFHRSTEKSREFYFLVVK